MSHFMGARGYQNLRSPSPILAPGINYYFVGTEQRLGGEFELRSVQLDYSLKLVTVSRLRHSPVSLHRVQL